VPSPEMNPPALATSVRSSSRWWAVSGETFIGKIGALRRPSGHVDLAPRTCLLVAFSLLPASNFVADDVLAVRASWLARFEE